MLLVRKSVDTARGMLLLGTKVAHKQACKFHMEPHLGRTNLIHSRTPLNPYPSVEEKTYGLLEVMGYEG